MIELKKWGPITFSNIYRDTEAKRQKWFHAYYIQGTMLTLRWESKKEDIRE